MKRGPPDDGQSSYKRPRHHTQNTFANSSPRNVYNHSSQPYRNSSTPSNRKQSSAQPDPAKSLQSLLKSLTSRPDATKQLLGEHGLESAIKLSNALSSQITTATASLDLFQPATVETGGVPTFSPALITEKFPRPALPEVPSGLYSQAPFTHKSTGYHDRVSAVGDLTYERLEFLGDAYLEVIATRLIYSRYPHLAAGRQAQIRERLVKNETLTQFSIAYNFQERLQANESERDINKASGKVLADVFEAYVAAVILSDPESGFKRAEAWLTELWAPILLRDFGPISLDGGAPFIEYNPNAKQELQQKVVGKDVKLEYLETRPMEQTKHVQRYFISLFMTGWGYEKQLLGSGEGQNKVEAGNRAAMDAVTRSKDIIEDAVRQLAAAREQRKKVQGEAAAAATKPKV